MKKTAAFVVLTLFVFGILMTIYINTDKEMNNISGKLIRLHIVANSDSPQDQTLKLKVRDEVIKNLSPKLETLKDIDEVRTVINENLPYIETIAQNIVDTQGMIYKVDAVLENHNFPTKMYGNLTLPAGTYQALNINIGKAEGKNWWCVMFPPLCFTDIAHGVAPEKTMEQLKQTLSEEEYKLVVAAKSNGEVPVKIKFKILEWAKSMKYKVATKK